MSLWLGIGIAALIAYLLKLSGYFVPPTLLDRPKIASVTSLLTVALLAALIAVQMFAVSGQPGVTLDARAPALLLAAGLLAVRAPFIVVVAAAAALAAGLRQLGMA